jgi:hypothetical protein
LNLGAAIDAAHLFQLQQEELAAAETEAAVV